MKRRHESFFFCSMASCLLIISLILLLALKNSSRVSEPLLLLSMALNKPLNVKALSKVTVISTMKRSSALVLADGVSTGCPFSSYLKQPVQYSTVHYSTVQYSTVQYLTQPACTPSIQSNVSIILAISSMSISPLLSTHFMMKLLSYFLKEI